MLGAGLAVLLASTGAATGANTSKQGGSSMLFERLRQLPDLLTEASARNSKDRYAELERLKQEYDAARKPYRVAMPYRMPPQPCASGEHAIPSVKHTLVSPARRESLELWEAEWHEAEVHGAALPEAVVRFLQNLGQAEATVKPMPASMVFAFGAVQLAKQESEITLAVKPVWSDAQSAPPPGFEDNVRTRRLDVDEFSALWQELSAIDFARYARVTDADFETTPPDLRHFERLSYVVDGKEIVSWGRSYAWLRAELRRPLATLERKLRRWAAAGEDAHGQGQTKNSR